MYGFYGFVWIEFGFLSSCGNYGNGGEMVWLWNVLIDNNYIYVFLNILMNNK